MCMEGYGKPVIQQRLSVRDREENPLLAESKFLKKLHFAPQNMEENPLLAEGSHFAPQNMED